MLNRRFANLDLVLHLSISLCLLVVACAAGVIGLRATVNGPWGLAITLWGISVTSLACFFSAWPYSRLEDRKDLEPLIERVQDFRKMRDDKTKETSGVILWKACRSVVFFGIAWLLFKLMPDVPLFFKIPAVIGLSLSIGGFGLVSSLASGWLLFFAAHLLVRNQLGFDFGDPVARAQFLAMWRTDSISLSWGWGIGVLVAVPGWVALSALIQTMSESLSRNLKTADENRKVEARIARRRKHHEKIAATLEQDLVRMASEAFEKAESRLMAVATGKEAPLDEGISPLAVSVGDKESAGVSRVRDDVLNETARKWLKMVEDIKQSEHLGLVVQSPGRLGFDRVVLGMQDEMRVFLSSRFREGKVLLDYYDELIATQNQLEAGGSGAVVLTSARAVARGVVHTGTQTDRLGDAMDEDDDDVLRDEAAKVIAELRGEQQRSGESSSASQEEKNSPKELAGETSGEADLLNPVAPAPGPTIVQKRRRLGMESFLDEMVAKANDAVKVENAAEDSEKEGAEEIAANLLEEEQAKSSGEAPLEVVPDEQAGSEAVAGLVDAKLETGTIAPLDEEVTRAPAEEVVPEGSSAPAEERPLEDPNADDPTPTTNESVQEPPASADALEIGADPEQSAEEVKESATQSVGEVGSEDGSSPEENGEDVRSAPEVDPEQTDSAGSVGEAFDGESSPGQEVGGAEAAPAEVEASPVVPNDAQPEPEVSEALRLDAFHILKGRIDADLVRRTASQIVSAEKLAGVMGVTVEMVQEEFDQYRRHVDGFEAENRLAAGLEGNEPAEIVQGLIRECDSSAWQFDADLLARAQAYVAVEVAAENARREAEEEAERERLARAEAERVELERIQLEAQRKETLEGYRAAVRTSILMGAYSEETMEYGAELFPTVEDLAASAGVDTEIVKPRYDEFWRYRTGVIALENLRTATEMKNRAEVERLLVDTSSFESLPNAQKIMQVAARYLDFEKAKESVPGFSDDGMIWKSSETVDHSSELHVRLKRSRKMAGIDDDVGRLIDEELVGALSVLMGLENMGSSPHAPDSIKLAYEEAKAKAARLIHKVLQHGDNAVRYIEWGLPAPLRKAGMSAEEMLRKIIAECPVERPEEIIVTDRPEPPTTSFLNLEDDDDESADLVDISGEEYVIKCMERRPQRPDDAHYVRFFSRKLKPMVPPDVNPVKQISDGLIINLNGHIARIILTNYGFAPVFYDKNTNDVYAIHFKDGTVNYRKSELRNLLNSSETRRRYDAESDMAEAIVYVSSWVDEVGEESFKQAKEIPSNILVVNGENMDYSLDEFLQNLKSGKFA